MVFWERLRNPYPPWIESLLHDTETPRRDPLFRLRGLVSVFTGTGPLRRLGRMGADPAQTPCQLSHLREGYGGDKEGGQGETRELIRRKGTPRIFSSIRRNRWPISQPHRHRPVHTDPVPRDPAPAGEHLHPRCGGVAQPATKAAPSTARSARIVCLMDLPSHRRVRAERPPRVSSDSHTA